MNFWFSCFILKHFRLTNFNRSKDNPPAAKKRKNAPKEKALVETEDTEFTGKCSFCPKTFANKILLSCHEQRVHGEKIFQCQQCPKSYAMISDLKQHVKMVHERFLKCSECNFTCGLDHLLKKHISENHSNAQLTCDQCGYKSKNLGLLR